MLLPLQPTLVTSILDQSYPTYPHQNAQFDKVNFRNTNGLARGNKVQPLSSSKDDVIKQTWQE